MKCVLCNGKTVGKEVAYKEFGMDIGTFNATVCTSCGETYFAEEVAEIIQQKSKELGLFGLAKKVKIAEIGNSIAIRIPKEIAVFLDLEKGKDVLLMPKDKHDLLVHV